MIYFCPLHFNSIPVHFQLYFPEVIYLLIWIECSVGRVICIRNETLYTVPEFGTIFFFCVLLTEYKIGSKVDSVKLKCDARSVVINKMTCKPSHCISCLFVYLFNIKHYNAATLPMLWCFIEFLL